MALWRGRTTPPSVGVTPHRADRRSFSAAAVVVALLASGCKIAASDTAEVDTAPSAPAPTTAGSSSARPTAPTSTAAPDPPATTPTSEPETAQGTATALLATLDAKGRAPMTGYGRERFGQAWLDTDRNGCDTRNDVLGDYLVDSVFAPGTRDCVVSTGTLKDPYTGNRIDFVYGDGTLVDVDHVVSLGNSWVTGAFGWDVNKRAALANDPLNLLPVDASANRQKGDGDAATWLPPDPSFRCSYVARQVSVKAKYGLWVTPAERAAIEQVLASCPGQAPVPDSGAPVSVDQNITDPGAPTTASPPGEPGGATYYESCDAARADGAAPVRRGDPGYGAHLDGDDDGISCE